MKASITIAALLIAGMVSAQTDDNYSDLLKRHKNPEVKILGKDQFDALQKFNYLNQNDQTAKLLSVLPNGNRVYSLPQDNMPCIVPQMDQFLMPNAGDKVSETPGYGAIPNPAPKIIIPTEKKDNASWIHFDMRRKN
jgi:hypothetical protein